MYNQLTNYTNGFEFIAQPIDWRLSAEFLCQGKNLESEIMIGRENTGLDVLRRHLWLEDKIYVETESYRSVSYTHLDVYKRQEKYINYIHLLSTFC